MNQSDTLLCPILRTMINFDPNKDTQTYAD